MPIVNSTILECLNVQSWKAASDDEVVKYVDWHTEKNRKIISLNPKGLSLLIVRKNLIPVDIYCYLKARFGEPNGFQNFLRRDDSDNWIHWEYLLLAGKNYISICGTSRETHFQIYECLADNDWHTLIDNIKADFGRVGKNKAAVLNTLEKWVIFPNKFVQIAGVCADLHRNIELHIGGFEAFHNVSGKADLKNWEVTEGAKLRKIQRRMNGLYRNCLELSLLTPVLAEAFINMTILMLCKKEIKQNPRQLDSFIRSQIDAKVFDLFYKCEHFIKKIDPNSDVYKNFKRVIDKRNHAVHGNIDPVREQTEIVYFDGKRPLFTEAGDHIGKLHESLERLHQPQIVLIDYINTYLFLLEIVSCLHPKTHFEFWQVMEDAYPGYDVRRNISGKVLPEHVLIGIASGVRYDDELAPKVKS